MSHELQPSLNETTTGYRNRVSNALSSFLTENNLQFVIGLSGGSEHLTQREAIGLISDFVDTIQDSRCAILTGGTQGGIPEWGVKIARASSVPTIGVFPSKGRKYALYPELDLAIETHDPTIGEGTFGTETPSFVQLLDGATVIGGSFGTLTEVATILKVNNGRVKKGQNPIYLCPISGTGGVADVLSTLPDIGAVRGCLPEQEIRTGKNAALFLRSKLQQ